MMAVGFALCFLSAGLYVWGAELAARERRWRVVWLYLIGWAIVVGAVWAR